MQSALTSWNPVSSIDPHSHVSVKHQTKMKKSLCFSPPVAEVDPVCYTVNAHCKEIFPVTVCEVRAGRDTQVHRHVSLSSSVLLYGQKWGHLWPECLIIPLMTKEQWEISPLFVVCELFSGEELWVPQQKTAHQHTEAAIRSASQQDRPHTNLILLHSKMWPGSSQDTTLWMKCTLTHILIISYL